MSIEKQKARLLGEFLKSRREKLSPSEAGLPFGYGTRRTPGLRREEVAQLAHVSTTWYTWLEQGRAVTPSRQVLDSIAKALLLSENEHLHLLHMANMDVPGPRASERPLSPDVEKIVLQVPYPAFVATDRTEVLHWNAAAGLVIGDFASMRPEDRNIAWLVFTDMNFRLALADWEEYAQYTSQVLRGRYEKNLNDLPFRKLVDRLLEASPEFRSLWSTRDITEKTIRTMRFNHPEAGPLTFNVNSFSQINGDAGVHSCFYIPVEGTGTEEKLRLLAAR